MATSGVTHSLVYLKKQVRCFILKAGLVSCVELDFHVLILLLTILKLEIGCLCNYVSSSRLVGCSSYFTKWLAVLVCRLNLQERLMWFNQSDRFFDFFEVLDVDDRLLFRSLYCPLPLDVNIFDSTPNCFFDAENYTIILELRVLQGVELRKCLNHLLS